MILREKITRKLRDQRGMSMVELMIAMVVLAVGVLAILALITVSIRTNNRTKMDTGGTMVAQMVMETITSQSNPAQTITVRDCANTAWIISGQDGAAPGLGANLNAAGGIDFGQGYAAVPNNYKMRYVECGPNGSQMTYDVRWNVRTVNGFSRIVTVSARPAGAATAGNGAQSVLMFQAPVTLRSIAVQGN